MMLGNWTAEQQAAYLTQLGLPVTPGAASQSAPWFGSMAPNCQRLLRWGSHAMAPCT